LSVIAAQRLFRKFFGRDPEDDEIGDVATREPETCIVIGELDGIIYRIESSKEPMIHRFKKTSRPLLLVSSDGKQIYILKGGYRFTERGFVG
jgi:hypothetical protein